jgi:hypothetical protein
MLDRGVWFPGEHASLFEGFGAVARAYLSGERMVGRLLGVWFGKWEGGG